MARCRYGRTKLPECEFTVFDAAAYPLILGQPFIRSTSASPVCPLRLSRREPSAAEAAKQASPKLGAPTYFQLRQGEEPVSALGVLDRGSSRNLMSLSYAKASNHHISLRLADRPSLVLGNGALAMSSGTVRTSLLLPGEPQVSSSLIPDSRLSVDFVILDGLPFDVAIGNGLLRKHTQIRQYRPATHYPFISTDIARLLATLDKDEKGGVGR